MSGLFDDSSDDDDEDNDAIFDDVVGSSAPADESRKKKNAAVVATTGLTTSGVDDDDADMAGEAESPSKQRRRSDPPRPPQNATVLEADLPKPGVSLHMTKLPNLVAIQPTAFDPADYDEKDEEEQYKGYVHNMIRWRYKRDDNGNVVRDANNKLVRESNSKLVKWSDGSFTLHIGSEAFDIQTVDSSSNGFPGLNGFVYLSQMATFKTDEEEGEEQNGGTVLECVGKVASRLVAKPSSLQSEAHKSLTVAVRQRTIKKARIAEYVTEEDPEKAKLDRIRTNTDADKQRQRKRAAAGGGGTAYRGGSRRNPGMNRGYLEASDDEQYDSINIRALKKGSANYDMDEMDDYGEDSDDDYGETFASRTRKRQRKAAEDAESDDEEEELVFDDEDDEEEDIKMHSKKKAQPHAAVLDDED
jgi:RNA polymerase-associated protein LEO1